MKKAILRDIILLFILIIALNYLMALRIKIAGGANPLNAKAQNSSYNHIGEKITYEVKLGKIRLGQAHFANVMDIEINGRMLNLMTFQTRLAQFRDTEKIYSDPQTLLPVQVERDIVNWFVKEKITEEYDQDNYTVTIIKNKKTRTEKTVIKKDSHIHNAVLLPYFVRRTPELSVGRILIANLPTRRLEIKLVSIEEIEVPAGTFQAYHFQSTPKQIDIWISADERRIPVKIQGNGLFNYALVMKEYSP